MHDQHITMAMTRAMVMAKAIWLGQARARAGYGQGRLWLGQVMARARAGYG